MKTILSNKQLLLLSVAWLLFCPLPTASFAQNTFRYQVCPDVGPLPRWAIGSGTVHQLPSDSGYVSFSSASLDAVRPNDTAGWDCFSSTKLDKYGNLVWIRTYQEISNLTHKYPSDGIPTTDSGFIMAGQKNKQGNPYYNGTNTYVQKIDKDGHLQWAKQYKVTSNDENNAFRILQMPDGGYIVMGQTKDVMYSDYIHTSYNTYLLRLDKDGTNLWCYYYDAKKNGEEHPLSLDLAADGGFIIGGGSTVDEYYGFDQNTSMFGYKALMIKVSANGQTVEWARRYGEVWDGDFPISSDFFYDTKQANDGGYISVGATQPNGLDTKGWVVKTNDKGAIVWQKTYDTWSGIGRVEVVNDGYLLSSTENEGNNNSGSGYGRITKISLTGEVEWSKLYDSGIGDINLAMDKGFVMNMGGSIAKTTRLGEFDKGCVFSGALSSWVDARMDTLYNLTPTSVNLTPSNLSLKEFTIERNVCPVLCGISDTPVAPSYLYAGTACADTDAPISVNPYGDNTANFSHYKVNFGDPASGQKNEVAGSSMTDYGQVVHNYSNPGTYTITMVVYNGDYSQSDTVSTNILVVPKIELTVLTPEINVCKRDTVILGALVNNYVPGTYAQSWTEEDYYTSNNQSILSQTTGVKDSVLTTTATVVADTAHDYYVIRISNAYTGGCSVSDTVRVKVGDNKAVISGNTKICTGAGATLKASGGDSYLWNTGANTESITVSPASNKTYWVQAATDDGCRDTGYVYVKVVSDISVEVFADRKNVCTGDTVKLYATGASDYTWYNGSIGDTIKAVVSAPGSTAFLVTGKNGSCSNTASIIINADDKPAGSISGGPASMCPGVEYTITASGGDSYYWYYSSDRSNPVQTIKLSSSEYSNAVDVYNGSCFVTVEYYAPGSSSPGIGGIEADECRVCPGTEVTLRKYFYPIPSYYTDLYPDDNPNNQGLTYQWSTGETYSGPKDSIKVTVIRDTLITLTTTNSYGCSVTNSVRLEATPHFYIRAEAASVASCSNTPTTLFLSGEPLDGEYSWSVNRNGTPVLSSNDTLVASFSSDTMLYITATANGCTRTDSVWVYAKSNLPRAVITGDAVVCKGVASTYTASGNAVGIAYLWLADNSTNPTLSVASAKDTTVKAVVTFTGGCADTAEYKISVTEAPKALISGDTLVCPGATVSLKASGGNTYQWSTGSSANNISVMALSDTSVSLSAFSGNCSNTASVIIKTNQTITATIFSDEDTICAGTALTLIAGGGDDYEWNTGAKEEMTGILPAISAAYTVSVTTADNCRDAASITITVNPSPTLSVSGETTLCSGKSVTLQATGSGASYLWNTGASTAGITVSPIKDSAYSVSTFIEQCSDSVSHTITVLATTSISAGAGQTVLSGTEVTLEATGGTNYSWSTAEDGLLCDNCNSLVVIPVKTTTYYLIETNSICAEDSVTIYVLNCSGLFVPTAFSPNNDNVNDVLYVKNDCVKELDFKIYDRWGNTVFQSTDVSNGWDGMYKGEIMDPAVFVYYVNATIFSGEVLTKKGNVSLIR